MEIKMETRSTTECFEKYVHPDILRHIFTFIGGKEYRYIAAVSKMFHIIYTDQYPKKLTSKALIATSVNHAEIFCNDAEINKNMDRCFDVVLKEASINGNVAVVEWLVSFVKRTNYSPNIIQPSINKCLPKAAAKGYLEIVKCLLENYDTDICIHKCGNLDCLKYLLETGHFCYGHSYDKELTSDFDCIQYLHVNHHKIFTHTPFLKQTMISCARDCFESFQYLNECGFQKWDEMRCMLAALSSPGNNLQCVQYIHTVRPGTREQLNAQECCLEASRRGALECLQYLHGNGYPWDESCCLEVSRRGALECLKYLHENGCPWDEKCTFEAVRIGSLECLQYLHENGCPWDEKCTFEAVRIGSLECLQYLHENGCPWDEKCTLEASNRFSLECLQYLHENGCPWHESCCHKVLRYACFGWSGSLECLQYLHQNGCSYFKKEDLFWVIYNGNWDKVEPLKNKFFKESWRHDRKFCQLAIKKGRVDIVKNLLEHGFSLPKSSCVTAAKYGHIECLIFLHASGSKLTRHAIDAAIRKKQLACIHYCTQQGVKQSY